MSAHPWFAVRVRVIALREQGGDRFRALDFFRTGRLRLPINTGQCVFGKIWSRESLFRKYNVRDLPLSRKRALRNDRTPVPAQRSLRYVPRHAAIICYLSVLSYRAVEGGYLLAPPATLTMPPSRRYSHHGFSHLDRPARPRMYLVASPGIALQSVSVCGATCA